MMNFVSNLKRKWAVLGGAIAALGGLFSVLDIIPKLTASYEHAWTLSFIPDVLVFTGLALLIGLACVQWGLLFWNSYVHVLRAGLWWQKLALIVLSGALLGSAVTSFRDWKSFYRVRVFSAKFNWNYYKAKLELSRGDFTAAIVSFKEIRGDSYLSKQLNERRRGEESDTRQRIADAQNYITRYKQAMAQGSASMADLLLAQRASRLYPDAGDVLWAVRDAQQRVRVGLESYFAGIEALQQKNFGLAQSKLQESAQKSGVRFFDQELLLRYCGDPDARHFTPSDLEIVAGYLRTPVDHLRFCLKDQHEWIAELRSMGSSPLPMYDPRIFDYYQQMIERDKTRNADDDHSYGPL